MDSLGEIIRKLRNEKKLPYGQLQLFWILTRPF